MPLGLLGRKMGMSQIFTDQGELVPVTVVEAGPCVIVQKKTPDRDGYSAIQLGFREKTKGVNRPLSGHFKKVGVPPMAVLREVSGEDTETCNEGDRLTVDIFQIGEKVDVTGVSKGRGFAGVVKRYGMRGGPASHGSMSHRRIGSIGAAATPSRVVKGHRMPGRMGGIRKTIQNLEVMRIDSPRNLIFLRGAVPGRSGGLLEVRKAIKGGSPDA